MKPWLALIAPLLFGACQTTSNDPVDSPSHPPSAGSRVTLNQPITIPPERTRLYFQFGQPVSGVNEFETNCVFEVNIVRDTAQRIVPDQFVVTQVRAGSSVHMTQRANSSGIRPVLFGMGDSGPMRYYYKTALFLHSPRQPDVLMLTCQHAWYTGDHFSLQRPPTVAEMRQAMGNYFTLTLSEGI